jgi:hypothetical protein
MWQKSFDDAVRKESIMGKDLVHPLQMGMHSSF